LFPIAYSHCAEPQPITRFMSRPSLLSTWIFFFF